MALRNGVLLQSERFWAAAVRSPGGGVNVTSGEKPRIPARHSLQRVPLLRGLLRLGESLAVLLAVRRSRRGKFLEERRAAAGVSLAPILLLLRDSRLARYHGAEHKSVAAYESGLDPAAARNTRLLATVVTTSGAMRLEPQRACSLSAAAGRHH